MENKTHIEIEQMMFGDYRVQVWDERNDSLLDREYFVRGFDSALLTALNMRTLPSFEKLDIWARIGTKEPELINKYEEKDA